MNNLRRYGRIAVIGYAITVSLFCVSLWGLHSYGYLWAARLDHDSWAARGADYLELGRMDRARREFRALVAVHPQSPIGWAGLIESYRDPRSETKEMLEIAEHAREALKDAHATTGDLLYAHVQFEIWSAFSDDQNRPLVEVEEILNTLETQGSLPVEGWRLRSRIAFENGLAKAFVEALHRLAEAPLEGSSNIYLRRREEALAVSRAEDDAMDIGRKVRAYEILGEWEKLRDALSAAEVNPVGELGYLSGIVAEIDGNIEDAAKIYSQAAAATPARNGPSRAMNRLRNEYGDDVFE